MYLAYYDEAGDDGFPKTQSDLFVLTGIYFNHQLWKENFEAIRNCRKEIQKKYGLNAKQELHIRKFMENTKEYAHLGLGNSLRVDLLDFYCNEISKLHMKTINTVINKKAIIDPNYLVLDRCLTYSLHRIENDLGYIERDQKKNGDFIEPLKFLMFVDPGREGKMTKTARKIQKVDYISSLFDGNKYNCIIKRIIEDPIPRISKHSYFIQISDFIVSVIYLYKKVELGIGKIPLVIPQEINFSKFEDWLNTLLPVLNTKASRKDKYGIVCYPNP